MIIDCSDTQHLGHELLTKLGVDPAQAISGSLTIEHLNDTEVKVTWTGYTTMPANEFWEFFNQYRARSQP